MPGEERDYQNYIMIVQGTIKQKVEEGTEGAVRREYEHEGVKKVKWEKSFRSWKGNIVGLYFKTNEHNGTKWETLNIKFSDAILSLGINSSFFQDFGKKFMNIDLSQEVTLAPYDYEPNSVRRVGLTIYQEKNADKVKVENYYWNDVDKCYANGFPAIPKKKDDMTSNDWKIFYIGVEEFLKNVILAKWDQYAKENPDIDGQQAKVEEVEEKVDYIQQAQDKANQEIQKVTKEDQPKIAYPQDEINVEDIPF